MSIADKLTQLSTIRTNIRNALVAKSVSASDHDFADFATDIASIPSGGGEVLDDYGLPFKDTGYDWETNYAIYYVFDSWLQSSDPELSYYDTGATHDDNTCTATVGIMEGTVYVTKKTLTKTRVGTTADYTAKGLLSEFDERFVVIRLTGNITKSMLPNSPCVVYMYGKMPTLTQWMHNDGASDNGCASKLRKIDLSGTVANGNWNAKFFCSDKYANQLRYIRAHGSESATNLNAFIRYTQALEHFDWDIPHNSQPTILSGAFTYCDSKAFNTLDFSWLDVSRVTNIQNLFLNATGIVTLNCGGWDFASATNVSSAFNGMKNLINFTAPIFYKNVIFSNSTLLTHTSLMSIINNLATVSTTQTLTLGATNIAKLTAEEIAIATNKGWTVA